MKSGTTGLLLGLIMGLLAAISALRGVQVESVKGALIHCSWSVGAIVVVGIISFLLVKTIRWKLLLDPLRPTAVHRLFPAVVVGSAANYALPHVGELLRLSLVNASQSLARSSVLATIAIERLLDISAISILGVILLTATLDRAEIDHALQALVVTAACCGAITIALLNYSGSVAALCRRAAPKRLPRLAMRLLNAIESSMLGLQSLRTPGQVATLVLVSIIQWTCVLVCIAASMTAVGLDTTVGSTAAVLIMLAAGLLLPSAPGYVGTTQLAFVLALLPLGYERNTAFTASIVYNAITVLTVVGAALSCVGPLRRELAAKARIRR